ncbi:hypothetical protein BJY01DRAFT_120704 [Aspergillus pseudoustus]|uniref:Zn(2)-C6 fungal-type domain-containing protein n=1 Tax=Aspergillus pseudoustus TaxID=1810923 RepID=A0ABR4IQV6_9EURO
MDAAASDETGARPRSALHVCSSCKKNKRRCDKRLPRCGSCLKTGRACNYSGPPSSSKSEAEVSDLQRRVRELEHHLLPLRYLGRTPPATPLSRDGSVLCSSSNLSIQAYYLDSGLWSSHRIPDGSATIPAPREISVALGGEAEIQSITATYFQTVHFYLPFVSKIKVARHIQSVEGSLKADIALLLLCMKLVQEVPNIDDPQSFELYDLAKDFRTKLGLHGVVTLRALQANILLLLYEIGHGIFPAAFMTVGACARQGVALGLGSQLAPQLAGKAQSWVDVEERRRTWWTVVILDRYVALGGCYGALCTDDPASDMPLPTDDAVWNHGQIVPPELIPLSSKTSPIGIIISPFARVAQASLLLGQVIKHCDNNTSTPDLGLDDIGNFNQLSHEIYSLIDIIHNQNAIARLDVTVARTLCFSALFKLANHYYASDSATSREERDPGAARNRERLCRCVEIIDDICGQVSTLIGELRGLLTREAMKLVSPLFLNCFYVCARNVAWMVRETDDLRLGGLKRECEDLLRLVESRWRVAGVYLELLKIGDAGPGG